MCIGFQYGRETEARGDWNSWYTVPIPKGFTHSVKHGQMWVTLLTSNHTLLIVLSHASVSELSYRRAAAEQPQTTGNLKPDVGHMTG